MHTPTRLRCESLEGRLVPAVVYALSDVGPGVAFLRSLDSATPAVTSSLVSITGLGAGDTLVGLDFRPRDGALYGLGVNAAADTATLYRIPLPTAVSTGATAVGGVGAVTGAGDLLAPSAASGYGIDFDPVADQLRVVSGALNFRVDPTTGTRVMSDTPLSGAATTADAVAYTNNAAGASATTPYALDAATNRLYILGPVGATPAGPNGGVLGNALPVTLNGQPLDFTAVGGFDIPAGVSVATSGAPAASGAGFAVLAANGETALYSIDLTTGAATRVGPVGNGTAAVQGLAVTPPGVFPPAGGTVSIFGGPFTLAPGVIGGFEGGNLVATLTRGTGLGPQTVTVGVTGGTATPGADFPAGPYTVTFAGGETFATLSIPLAQEAVADGEGNETVVLTITDAGTGRVGTPASVTLTIVDVPPPPAGPAVSVRIADEGESFRRVQITRANGGITTANASTLRPTPVAAAIIGDLNGGGPEVAILDTNGFIYIFDVEVERLAAIIGDFNKDGKLDLITRTANDQGMIVGFYFDGRTGNVIRVG